MYPPAAAARPVPHLSAIVLYAPPVGDKVIPLVQKSKAPLRIIFFPAAFLEPYDFQASPLAVAESATKTWSLDPTASRAGVDDAVAVSTSPLAFNVLMLIVLATLNAEKAKTTTTSPAVIAEIPVMLEPVVAT